MLSGTVPRGTGNMHFQKIGPPFLSFLRGLFAETSSVEMKSVFPGLSFSSPSPFFRELNENGSGEVVCPNDAGYRANSRLFKMDRAISPLLLFLLQSWEKKSGPPPGFAFLLPPFHKLSGVHCVGGFSVYLSSRSLIPSPFEFWGS